MTRLEEFVEAVKLGGKLKSQEDKKCCKNTMCWVLGIIGAVVVIAGIAYAVYRYLTPDYLEEFEDDFDDDLEEDFFEDESDDVIETVKKEEPAAEPVVETAEPEVSVEETPAEAAAEETAE